jgi:preprotein translocase subunit SecE
MTAPATTKKAKMTTYFKGVKAEMKKVNWPSKKELVNYTGVVIMISAIIAVIVGILDLLIHGALGFIIK